MWNEPNFLWVIAGLVLTGIACGVTGVFLTLKGDALNGDVMAHGVLPGVAAAFMLSGSRELYWLIPGACVSGWITLWSRNVLIRKAHVRPDTASAMALSVFYGLGVMLISRLRYSGQGAQSGLDRFLFGSAAAILPEEVWTAGILAIAILLIVVWKYRALVLLVFDPVYARVHGFQVKKMSLLLNFLTLISVVIGIQLVGVVLMSSMLVAPGIAASGWTLSLKGRLYGALILSTISVIAGTWVSLQWTGMPTGPWVVLFLSLFAFAGIFKRFMSAG